MYEKNIVKISKNLEKNSVSLLKFLNFQNKIELEFKALNDQIEDLKKKIGEQHLENIHSDEILLEFCRNWTAQQSQDLQRRSYY